MARPECDTRYTPCLLLVVYFQWNASLYYGTCWVQAIVLSEVLARGLGKPKFWVMQQNKYRYYLLLGDTLHLRKVGFSCGFA